MEGRHAAIERMDLAPAAITRLHVGAMKYCGSEALHRLSFQQQDHEVDAEVRSIIL